MGAVVFGHFTRPRLASADPAPEQNAFSLFYARSAAMGWLRGPGADESATGLWGMNDAYISIGDELDPPPIGWFQVVVLGAGGHVPAQPFLACVDDVLARLGQLDMQGVQLLLPGERSRGHEPDPDDLLVHVDPEVRLPTRARYALDWFADCTPDQRVGLRVTLACADASVARLGPAITNWVAGSRQQFYTVNGFSHDEADHLPLVPLLGKQGPHRLTLRGDVAEWSLPALGLVAELLVSAAQQSGLGGDLWLIARHDQTRS